MSVDLRKVKKLIELVEESGISELEVRDGDETIRIARHGGQALAVPQVPAAATSPDVASSAVAAGAAGPASSGHQVRSPMAGTFYRSPAPDAEPFVAVGQSVAPGDVLCIIESMKMMNEIKAEQAGVCTAVAVENGEAIGSGQLLFRFE
jgi:acetyl-CoA carboxylase biotin carboxyl carrier protein